MSDAEKAKPGSGEWARAKARDEALANQLDRIEGLVREQGSELRQLDRQLGSMAVTLSTLTERIAEEKDARRQQGLDLDALAHRVTALETERRVRSESEEKALRRAEKALTPAHGTAYAGGAAGLTGAALYILHQMGLLG